MVKSVCTYFFSYFGIFLFHYQIFKLGFLFYNQLCLTIGLVMSFVCDSDVGEYYNTGTLEAGGGTCGTCERNQYSANGVCKNCPAGKYKVSAASQICVSSQ